MRILLAKLTGNPWLLRRIVVLVMLAAVGTGAFYVGKRQGVRKDTSTGLDLDPTHRGTPVNSASGRIVAYIYGTHGVSREEYGEYLIARAEPAKLDFMLNRKIVEMECRKNGVFATDAEVEQRFQKDLGGFGPTRLTEAEFVNSILKRFNKTLYEWKEDVIRPKLMMEKLVRSTIKISDKDIQNGFEARYGPQVEVRMIVLERDNLRLKAQIWEEARKSKEKFLEQAGKQSIANLAAQGGKVPPIHRHFGDKKMEDAAFALKEGEVSSLIELQDGSVVILLCEKHVPANKLVTLTGEVRAKLYEEMFEMRVQQRIPEVFREMRQLANPRPVLGENPNPIQLTSHTPAPVSETPKSTVPAPTQTIHIPAPPTPGAVVAPKGLEAAPIAPSDPLPAPKIAPPMPTAKDAPMPMPMPTVTPMPMSKVAPPVVPTSGTKKN